MSVVDTDLTLKVWVYKDGMDYVATPVTKGRRPKPGLRSERRTYGVARSKNGALEALAVALHIPGDNLNVVDF